MDYKQSNDSNEALIKALNQPDILKLRKEVEAKVFEENIEGVNMCVQMVSNIIKKSADISLKKKQSYKEGRTKKCLSKECVDIKNNIKTEGDWYVNTQNTHI